MDRMNKDSRRLLVILAASATILLSSVGYAGEPTSTEQPMQASAVATGQKIYQRNCSVCHTSGVAGAPKISDSSAWKPRLTKGFDVILANAIKGFNTMPPKGTCATCTSDEIKQAIEFMLPKSVIVQKENTQKN